MAETAPKPPSSTTPPPSSGGPNTGDIVLVRQDIRTIIPAIVTNDYSGQNTGGVVAVVTFSAAAYGAGPVNAVPNCQPETKDTTAEDLSVTFQGYYMTVGSPLRDRDLAKEIEEHRAATEEAKPAT